MKPIHTALSEGESKKEMVVHMEGPIHTALSEGESKKEMVMHMEDPFIQL